MFSVLTLLTAALVCAAVTHGLAVLALAVEHLLGHRLARIGLVAPVLAVGLGALAAAVSTGSVAASTVVAVPLLVASALASVRFRRMRPVGVLFWATYLPMVLFGLAWTGWFIATLEVSTLTKTLMLSGAPLALLALPVSLVRAFESSEVLTRRQWRRPRAPLAKPERARFPRVSLHVPAHAEPPEVVVQTLDALARLDYPNYEVLVIDNNTLDPALWRPIEAHCERLGERFRFLHVEGITGAKAGALNWAMPQADPEAELIAVIDADYHADPDFLAHTVGYFDDPRMGFVQTPHAYRAHAGSPYLSACDREYAYFFNSGMPSLNERDAAITVGTMCVIRRRALEQAGGWAEWCLTEDSELAIRIHALGYSSVYLREVYGRGLIPETFAGYKKQRFRWTYGPVQEFKRHWRLFLPGRLGRRSQLTSAQRAHHATHGLYGIGTSVALLMMPLGLAVLVSMAAQREVVPVPLPLWIVATVLLLVGFTLRWLVYRVMIGARLREVLSAMVASAGLAHVILVANLTALLGIEVPWRRTDKFHRRGRGIGALSTVRAELMLGLGLLSAAGAAAVALPHAGLAMMLAIGLGGQGVLFLAAPAMALLAERDLRRRLDGVSAQSAAAMREPALVAGEA